MPTEIASLAGGCFWCLEAVFGKLQGVYKVESGYAGGTVPNPSYQAVCTGETGHAEVVQMEFDPSIISYEELLQVFFSVHDPTTLNRQGADIGTQYRSAIYYHSDEQKEIAEKVIAEIAPEWKNPIVTEVTAFDVFYRAEQYHQNYFALNPSQPYCAAVVAPKLKKFKQKFEFKLK